MLELKINSNLLQRNVKSKITPHHTKFKPEYEFINIATKSECKLYFVFNQYILFFMILLFFRITEDAKNTFSVILELNDVVETDAGLYKVDRQIDRQIDNRIDR